MSIKHYISLIRPFNLMIIFTIMIVTRYAILKPFLSLNNMDLEFSFWQFMILLSSVIFLSAYGYVSNDLGDIRSDAHNKKERILVIHPEYSSKAENFSFLLLLVGLFLGLLSWIIANNWMLVFIHFFSAASLFAYSKHLQKTVLIGNISIAMLCAVIPVMVLLFDMPSVIQIYYDSKGVFLLSNGSKTYNEEFFRIILRSILIFSSFIFIFTLIREIIKDVEDMSGDKVAGYRTLPIRFGERVAVQLAIGLGILSLILLMTILIFSLQVIFDQEEILTFISALFVFVALPLSQSMYLASKNKYRLSSYWIKMSMLGALVSSLFFGFLN